MFENINSNNLKYIINELIALDYLVKVKEYKTNNITNLLFAAANRQFDRSYLDYVVYNQTCLQQKIPHNMFSRTMIYLILIFYLLVSFSIIYIIYKKKYKNH